MALLYVSLLVASIIASSTPAEVSQKGKHRQYTGLHKLISLSIVTNM